MHFKCSPWSRTGLEPKKGAGREAQVETAPAGDHGGWMLQGTQGPDLPTVAGMHGKAT